MGSGFRTFQSGEVLTAANVQDFLMDQSVMVFAGTAARSSAIGSAETGMLTYRTDGTADGGRQGYEFYNGSAYTRLIQPVGLEFIASGTVAATTSAAFDNVFTSAYTNYRVVLSNVDSNGAETALLVRFSAGGTAATGANYNFQTMRFYSTSTAADFGENSSTKGIYISVASTTTNTQHGNCTFDVFQPQLARATSITGLAHQYSSAVTAGMMQAFGGFHALETAYDGMVIRTDNATTTVAFDYAIYGYRK